MRELSIVIVDDQPEVGQAITRDLADLPHTQLFFAGNAEEARAAIEDLLDHDQLVGVLLVDCVMPQESGVELLRSLVSMRSLSKTRRVMVTGQATQQDTIAAINDGHLHRYVEKPWQADELVQLVREELTRYILLMGEPTGPYGELMDQDLVRQATANDCGQV